MRALIVLLIVISSMLIIGNFYVQARTVPKSIDPRYDYDSYELLGTYENAEYYIFGSVKAWWVPRDSGYFRTIHYGRAEDRPYYTSGLWRSEVEWIRVCSRTYDSSDVMIVNSCSQKIEVSLLLKGVEYSMTHDFGSYRPYRAQTKVIAHFHYHFMAFHISEFTDEIPYSYIEVNW